MLELQIECTKQNQKNATFDSDLFSSLDSHRTSRELFSWLTAPNNSFPKILERTCISLFFFQVNCLYLTLPLKGTATKVAQRNRCPITCSITLGCFSEAGHAVTRHAARKRLKIFREIEGKVILFHFSKISLPITVNLKSHQLSIIKVTGPIWNIPRIYTVQKIIWCTFAQLNAAYKNRSKWKYNSIADLN